MGSFFIWSACGGGLDAPVGSTITITGPDSITDASTSTVTDTANFTIVVKNISGVPLDNVKIWISYPWAVPSPAGLVQLYDGDTAKDSPMSAETDSNGAYHLRLDYRRGGVDYTGNIQVVAGPNTGTAEFAVSSDSGTEG